MGVFNKPLRVNTIYGADGTLQTSYMDGEAAKNARKNVKAFNKRLAKYDKDFANYASLDIDETKINDKNTKYILGKLGVAEKYVEYMPTGDAAMCMGDDMTAIAGNKHTPKLGIKAKIANVFQPFFEKQAEKHPHLQKLSDSITKAANNGRMPLTSESAAVMRIAFDKKYYNDMREPGADRAAVKAKYERAIENLTTMARFDGVDMHIMSEKYGKKIIQQMQIDETMSDIYKGFATGDVRLARSKPVLNAKGEEIRVKGRTLYDKPDGFIKLERDEETGKFKEVAINPWEEIKPREPQSVDEIIGEYQTLLNKYTENCRSEADLKRMLASDSYKNIERNAKAYAEADCSDEADRFGYEFARANLTACRDWAIENNNRSPYAQLIIPPPYEEQIGDGEFFRSYTTSDYYEIDNVHDRAVDDVNAYDDEEIADKFAEEVTVQAEEMADTDAMTQRAEEIQAEVVEYRENADLNDVYEHEEIIVDDMSNNGTLEPMNRDEYHNESSVSEKLESVQPQQLDVSEEIKLETFDGEIIDNKPKFSAMPVLGDIAAFTAHKISERYGFDNTKAVIPVKTAFNTIKDRLGERINGYLADAGMTSENKAKREEEITLIENKPPEAVQNQRVSLMSVEQNGERLNLLSKFNNVFESLKAVAENYKLVDYRSSGTRISDVEYAEYEQSDKFDHSVDVNIDEKCVIVYEAPGIPEADRTDDNTKYNSYELGDVRNMIAEIKDASSDLNEQKQLFAEKRLMLECKSAPSQDNYENSASEYDIDDIPVEDLENNIQAMDEIADEAKSAAINTARYDTQLGVSETKSNDKEMMP